MPRAIAVAQTVPVAGDVDANIQQHIALAHLAAGASVVVFPELSLTGYELERAAGLAFAMDDPRLSPAVEAACATGATLIVGAPVRLERLHIGAFILSPDGSIDVYTKRHLGAFDPAAHPVPVPPPEASVFEPGDRDPVLDVGAIAVCADTGHASHPRAAAERGARTYLASMFVTPDVLEAETATLRAYAVRHRMAVAFANYAGTTGGLPSGGCSTIWAADGSQVARLEPEGAGVAIAVEDDGVWRGRTATLSVVR